MAVDTVLDRMAVGHPPSRPVTFTLNGTTVTGLSDESLIDAATRPDAGKPKSKAVAGTEPKVNLGAASPDDAQAAPKSGSPGPDVVFLKRVHQGACALFGTVLGPDANAAHREHLHFDLKARRGTAYCQ